MRRIKIFDTTLRDGEQSPGIALRPDEKAEIARALELLGVDIVEAGFAASSPGDFQGVAAVVESLNSATVASLARTTEGDIDAAAQALAGAPRSRIHVFIATSALHMERKLGLTPPEVLERISWAVAYAAERADEVEFSAEDATRSDRAFLAAACREAIAAGATIVNLPDTVGFTTPGEYARMFDDLRERCPELGDVELSVHCHDDLGLAVANSLAGIEAGATQVECTVNGIGERAGNAALEEIVMALRVRSDVYDAQSNVEPGSIRDASALVAELTGYAVQRNKPIVGANAFAHEAGIHQDGMLKDASTYQIIDPSELGVAMTLPLGKHSGRHAFTQAVGASGRSLAQEELDAAFRRFKQLADTGAPVSIDDVLQEVQCMTENTFACLAGDGVGPELMAAATRALDRVAHLHSLELADVHLPFAGEAVTRSGHPLPPETRNAYRGVDAILVSSRHEPAFEGVKADLQLAWRIARVQLGERSDVVVIAPMGAWADSIAVERAFSCASSRRGQVATVSTDDTWFEFVERERSRWPGMHVERLGLGEAVVRLKESPGALDVVVTESHLLDGLVDAASHFAGSKASVAHGWMPDSGPGVFAPGESEADDLGGFNAADPAGMLLTASLLLGEGLHRRAASRTLERAVGTAVGRNGSAPRETRSFTDAVIALMPDARTDVEHFDEVWR